MKKIDQIIWKSPNTHIHLGVHSFRWLFKPHDLEFRGATLREFHFTADFFFLNYSVQYSHPGGWLFHPDLMCIFKPQDIARFWEIPGWYWKNVFIRHIGNLEVKPCRNVPADPLPPEPERFCGRREVLYLTPLPHPQHLAEGLPYLYQRRPDGLVPILLKVPYLYLV